MFLTQNKIQVFPFGNTRGSDPLSRVLNEQNITRLVTSLTDKSSYVIRVTDTLPTACLVEFVLQGYYFKADVSSVAVSSQGNRLPVYAAIKLESINGYTFLSGGDVYATVYGSGTASDPFIMSKGSVSKRLSSDMEHYFKYKFEEPGDIRVYNDGSFVITSISQGSVTTVGNVTTISCGADVSCTIVINKVSNVSFANVYMEVVSSDYFTGVQFYSAAVDVPQDYDYIQLLDESGNVPKSSLVKFTANSFSVEGGNLDDIIPTKLSQLENDLKFVTLTEVNNKIQAATSKLEFDVIYCGSSTEVV